MAHGKYGRVERDTSRFSLKFENYLRVGGLEAVPGSADVDRASKVPEWPMYLNGPDPANPPASPDGIGDCTIAGIMHSLAAMCVFSGQPFPLFAPAEVITAYSAVSGYNPATGADDNGAQMQDVLRYGRETGFTDTAGKLHKLVTYASLGSPSNAMLLSQVCKTFGCAYVGINCPASAQVQFGQIWEYVAGSPIEGGHCIGLHRRWPYGSMTGVFDYSTWGALQRATLGFNANYIEESWAFTSEDWMEANGSDIDGYALAALEADMRYV